MTMPVAVSRYMDQLEADKFAEDFLLRVSDMIAQPSFCNIEWHGLDGADGRVGTLRCRGVLKACATVVRDQMNWSDVVAVSFLLPSTKGTVT